MLSDLWGMEGIRSLCESFMISEMDSSNCLGKNFLSKLRFPFKKYFHSVKKMDLNAMSESDSCVHKICMHRGTRLKCKLYSLAEEFYNVDQLIKDNRENISKVLTIPCDHCLHLERNQRVAPGKNDTGSMLTLVSNT